MYGNQLGSCSILPGQQRCPAVLTPPDACASLGLEHRKKLPSSAALVGGVCLATTCVLSRP